MTVTVWHLELNDPTRFAPSPEPLRLTLVRVTSPSAAFLRFLYVATGTDWHWTDRLTWTDQQWLARQIDPAVEVWVGWEGGAPAGYYELASLPDGRSVEIAYFGLLPHAVGTRQGGALLSAAVRRAWEMGAGRVYVNTCSLDHPKALENYKRRGFEVFETREK